MISPVQILLLQKIPFIGTVAIEATIAYLLSKKLTFPESDTGVVNMLKDAKKTYGPLRIPTQQSVQQARVKSSQILADSGRYDITIVSRFDDAYPEMLRAIPGSPLLLHYKGNLDVLKNPTTAMIGSRNCSGYTLQQGEIVADGFVDAGFTIISGLAVGCDAIAHKAAVKQGKPTVAVLGCGLHTVYPAENRSLAKAILENDGLLLSEHAFGTTITKNALKERNRIITGLSKGVVVLETGVSGGTMHAVAYAVEQKKPLACVYPSAPDAGNSFMEGNKVLIDMKQAVKLDSMDATARFIESVAEPQVEEMAIN